MGKMPKDLDSIKPTHSVDTLWRAIDLNIAERAILDLACVIHNRAQSLSSVVSHDEVVLAYSFYEQFGLEETLREIAKG